jgi:hypothetical protein
MAVVFCYRSNSTPNELLLFLLCENTLAYYIQHQCCSCKFSDRKISCMINCILSYDHELHASAVIIYNVTSSLAHFQKKLFSYVPWKNTQAYYNASVAPSRKFCDRRIGSWLILWNPTSWRWSFHLTYFQVPCTASCANAGTLFQRRGQTLGPS